jgi:hypothetical protein
MMKKSVYRFVKRMSAIGQEYYPETLGTMYIINAPLLFSGVWKVVKGSLCKRTRDKIFMLGKKYTAKLLEAVEPENLPSFLGGA